MKRNTINPCHVRVSVLGWLSLYLISGFAMADGVVVDKIYHPYVQAQEQEIEWRAMILDDQPGQVDHTRSYRLAYGRSLNDRWFVEAYLVAKESSEEDLALEAVELEALHQLTEQGEFFLDWGMLFELEKENNADRWEFSTALILEKELGRWSGTGNLYLIQEWGSDIDDELETALGLQARYRYSRAWEPALEFYSGQDTRVLGPVLLGQLKFGIKRQLKWEAGFLFGLDDTSPNQTLRLLAEFEF